MTADLTTTPDGELLRRIGEGDAPAVAALYDRYAGVLMALALRIVRDRAEAEDVIQEAFVRAYRALARFDGRSEPYTWFYRITINLSLNALRSRKSHRTTTEADDPRLDALMSEKQSTADPSGDARS